MGNREEQRWRWRPRQRSDATRLGEAVEGGWISSCKSSNLLGSTFQRGHCCHTIRNVLKVVKSGGRELTRQDWLSQESDGKTNKQTKMHIHIYMLGQNDGTEHGKEQTDCRHICRVKLIGWTGLSDIGVRKIKDDPGFWLE